VITERLPTAADLNLTEEEYVRIKHLNVEGVVLSEKGLLAEAIDKFSEAIRLCERFPSAYNNRAQARQLLREIDLAMEDLNVAIRLSDGIDTLTLKQV
jgi:tetratricopeptide (TPR) repeat protein